MDFDKKMSLNRRAVGGRRASDTVFQRFDGKMDEIAPELKAKQNKAVAKPARYSKEDIVQAVELFFDSILDPEQTAEVIRMLVGRLRAPVLHAVQANPIFLTDAHHPARRLIKVLFLRGHAISADHNYRSHPCYIAMLRVVDELVSSYQGDERLFLKAYFDISQIP